MFTLVHYFFCTIFPTPITIVGNKAQQMMHCKHVCYFRPCWTNQLSLDLCFVECTATTIDNCHHLFVQWLLIALEDFLIQSSPQPKSVLRLGALPINHLLLLLLLLRFTSS